MSNTLPDALILCGGAGLRLRSVTGDGPKSMANLVGRPFLEVLLKQLSRFGFVRVILAVGYRAEAIQAYFGDHSFGMEIVYSPEATPLGTGGATRNALERIESDSVLIMNGDSYTDADLGRLVAEHRASGAEASVVVVPADKRDDVGYVRVDENGRLTGFDEKLAARQVPHANAGIYVISRPALAGIAGGVPVSLEREVFPQWIAENRNIRAHLHEGDCVDIGTPERYKAAQSFLGNVEAGKAN